MAPPLILVTNDDGIRAEGLSCLSDAVAGLGDVWVVAPDSPQSAQSHALTLHKPLRVKEYGPQRLSVSGTPTDCVFMGVLHLLPRKPELVLSGINHGPNVGDDVSYSGTASAALEGCLMGIPSIAFSHINFRSPDFTDGARFARQIAAKILDVGLPPRVYLNVNFPDVPAGTLRGVRAGSLGRRWYENAIVAKEDPRGRPYYWIGGSGFHFEDVPGSDCNALTDHHISVTPIRADLTAEEHLGFVRGLELTLQ